MFYSHLHILFIVFNFIFVLDFEIAFFFFFVFNFLIVAVLPIMIVQEHVGNEKSWVWRARDFADRELKDELFCLGRFCDLWGEEKERIK